MVEAALGKSPVRAKSRKRRRALAKSNAAQAPFGKAAVSASGRIGAVMETAAKSGLLGEKDSRIAGRVSSAMVRQAKARTGIRSDSELLAFALANVALEDRFGETFSQLAGTVDPDLDLEL